VYTKLWCENVFENIHFEEQEDSAITLRQILEVDYGDRKWMPVAKVCIQ
jgi:hypothetical protein